MWFVLEMCQITFLYNKIIHVWAVAIPFLWEIAVFPLLLIFLRRLQYDD